MSWSSHIANQIYVLIMLLIIIYIECSCCDFTKVAPSRQLCYLLEQSLRKLSEIAVFN